MTKYREILRLSSLNLSQQNIADSCNVSKKTVNRVLKRAKELGISWPIDANETDAVLAEKFFPSAKQVKTNKRMPDYDYIRKELLRNGVSKKLLWTEYMEEQKSNKKTFLNFCIEDVRNPPRSFVLSMVLKNGMTNLVETPVLWQMRSLIVLHMTATVSTSQVLMKNMISR